MLWTVRWCRGPAWQFGARALGSFLQNVPPAGRERSGSFRQSASGAAFRLTRSSALACAGSRRLRKSGQARVGRTRGRKKPGAGVPAGI